VKELTASRTEAAEQKRQIGALSQQLTQTKGERERLAKELATARADIAARQATIAQLRVELAKTVGGRDAFQGELAWIKMAVLPLFRGNLTALRAAVAMFMALQARHRSYTHQLGDLAVNLGRENKTL
jgi:chromosome segregation ATPase